MARPTLSATMLIIAGALSAAPAAAQFNPFEAIFGPARPPGDVPNRGYPPSERLPPGPPPSQYPPQTRLPPGPPPSQQYPQQYPGQYPPSARLPPGVQTQPLPPPGMSAPRPTQPRRAAPPPGTPAPPPNDEIITAPPSQKIANPTAVFSGLDKVTGRIITFDVAINETVQFGALQVTPRVCYTRPPSETANTDSFLEVDEVTLQGEVRRIFTGWIFAASPGLSAIEHAIYDVWLVDCKGGTTVIAETPPEPAPAQQRPAPQRQQRPRQAPPPDPGTPPLVR
jgi:hypothetical protein